LVPQLQEQIPALMEKVNVPGLSLAIIRDANLFWAGGFGITNKENPNPVTTDTIFEGCSLSKPAFAYAALKLADQGIIDLDTPLIKYTNKPYIPDEPRLAQITMRHVLNHTPGFPNWRPDCWGKTGWEPEGKLLKMYLTPGKRFSYSGEGYMYLQRVLEQLTGKTGEAFMQEMVLEPLGMSSSTYIWSDKNQNAHLCAHGHDKNGKVFSKKPDRIMLSAASLTTTPSEFAQLMITMMQPSANKQKLSSRWIDKMLTPQIQMNNSRNWHKDWPEPDVTMEEGLFWGLGWGIQQHKGIDAFWHWGDNYVFRAFAVGFREEGIGVVIMANGENAPQIWEDVCQAAIGGEYPAISWLNRIF
ncbi:MAG: beta-lactamase family protein, partial [Chloroflexi bacterium]|nr:beta-lactamase family protein [Chloroflexota bacterium]